MVKACFDMHKRELQRPGKDHSCLGDYSQVVPLFYTPCGCSDWNHKSQSKLLLG